MAIDFLKELTERGLIHQVTATPLAAELQRGPVTLYSGLDPTADSLHVGSLLPLVTLLRFQRAGHRPIALVGGGTGFIGDPSGKDAERSLLSRDQINANVEGIRRQVASMLDTSGGRAVIANNADWLCELRLIDFLRDIGKHFSVNQMITRDSVRNRLEARESGISYTEFSYMLLQAYDYLALFDRERCTLQIGGSDQWGNIVSGADLVRRLRGTEVHALTWPLLLRADGKKFGKSESGNIWLAAERTSPYEFYQFWLNTDDADVVDRLNKFTFRTPTEIAELAAAVQSRPQERAAQRLLAADLTRLVHGDAALQSAERTTAALFSKDADFRALSAAELDGAFRAAPRTALPAAQLGRPEAALLAVLVSSGLYESRGLAKKDVPLGGVSVNNRPVTDIQYTLSAADVLAERFIVLRKGKKTYHVLEISL